MTVHRNKFLYDKNNRRTNFQIYSGTKLYMFRAFSLPIIRSFPLYVRHWHMLYSLRVGSGWNCSSILILQASSRQTCIACAIAECTVGNYWWWTEKLPETCRVWYQNKLGNQCVCCFIVKKSVARYLTLLQVSGPSLWSTLMVVAGVPRDASVRVKRLEREASSFCPLTSAWLGAQ
jgi:hypothetical protein